MIKIVLGLIFLCILLSACSMPQLYHKQLHDEQEPYGYLNLYNYSNQPIKLVQLARCKTVFDGINQLKQGENLIKGQATQFKLGIDNQMFSEDRKRGSHKLKSNGFVVTDETPIGCWVLTAYDQDKKKLSSTKWGPITFWMVPQQRVDIFLNEEGHFIYP